MKISRYLITLLVILLGVISISACGNRTEAPITQTADISTEVNTDIISTSELGSPVTIPTITPNDAELTFSGDVLPIFLANCTRCHGTSRQSAGLKLNTYENIIAGSENGPVIMPGDSTNSLLIDMIVSGEMPKKAEKLSDANIQLITDWINAGALDN
jgi:cytochrome c553